MANDALYVGDASIGDDAYTGGDSAAGTVQVSDSDSGTFSDAASVATIATTDDAFYIGDSSAGDDAYVGGGSSPTGPTAKAGADGFIVSESATVVVTAVSADAGVVSEAQTVSGSLLPTPPMPTAWVKLSRPGSTMIFTSGVDASDIIRRSGVEEMTRYGATDKTFMPTLRSGQLKFSGPAHVEADLFFAQSTGFINVQVAPLSTRAGRPLLVASSTAPGGKGCIPTKWSEVAPSKGRVSWAVELLVSGAVKSTVF